MPQFEPEVLALKQQKLSARATDALQGPEPIQVFQALYQLIQSLLGLCWSLVKLAFVLWLLYLFVKVMFS